MAKVGKIGLRTARGITNTVIALLALFLALSVPQYYFFTVFLLYITWGLLKSVLIGFLDRLPGGDPLLDEDEDEAEVRAQVRAMDYADLGPNVHSTLRIDDDEGLEERR